jgi:DNA-binding NtrC family response regulator
MAAAENRPIVVVVIDDEVTVRTTARAILTRAGFAVEVADDGRSALALLGRLGAAVAVVILDWTLPDVAGSSILAEVQAAAPQARIIVSTGFGREDVLLPPADGKRVHFLEKPYTAAALVNAVRACLELGPGSHSSSDE